MSIGERIKCLRIQRGMSIDELAVRLGKNRTTVYRYEKGDIENLPIDALKPLAEILETSPAYLMGWDVETNEDAATVGDLLKLIRKQQNMSIEEFSKKLGITPDKLYMYETGEKYIPIGVINTIADYYRLSSSIVADGFKNDVRLERFKVWAETFGHLEFTDEEHDKIVEYAMFLISIREK